MASPSDVAAFPFRRASGPTAQAGSLCYPLPFRSLVLTALHALEVRNAFNLGVFRGLFAIADANAAWRNLESDLRSGRLVKKSVKWPLILRVAARLSELHSAAIGTRSLDIIHVAVAKALRAVEFVSFDARQRTLAATVGLKVSP